MGQARWEAERGATLFEMLVTVAVGALLIFAILYAATSFNHSLRQSATLQAATTGAETLVDSLERDAHSGQAIFTPARDVAGNDNTDGHEVAFYARDTAGAGHFWSYCHKAGAGKCLATQPANAISMYHYGWSELPQNGGAGATLSGTIAENVTTFKAQTVPASSLLDATLNPISAAYFRQIGITRVVDVPRQMGFPGVIGGNRVTIVSLSTVAGPRVVHLMASEMTTRRLAIVGTYTPPPNALRLPNGASLHFWSPLAPQQSATIAESNYGIRTTNPAQIYTIIGTSCPPYTTWNPTSTLTPMNDGSGDAQLNVTPIKQVESTGKACGFTIADNVGQTTNVGVNIDPTQAPTAAYVSGALLRNSTITFSVQEGNYVSRGSALSRGGAGGFTAAADGTICTGATLASVTSNGGPSALGNGPESESWTVSAGANAGTCSITFTDTYGQTATASVTIAAAATTPPPNPCMFGPDTVLAITTNGIRGRWQGLSLTFQGYPNGYVPAGINGYVDPNTQIIGGNISGDMFALPGGRGDLGTFSGSCSIATPAPVVPVNNTIYTCDPALVGTSYVNVTGGITTYARDPACGGTPVTPAPATPTPGSACAVGQPATISDTIYGFNVGDCIGPCQIGPTGQPQMPDWTGGWWAATNVYPGCGTTSTPTPSPTPTAVILFPTPTPLATCGAPAGQLTGYSNGVPVYTNGTSCGGGGGGSTSVSVNYIFEYIDPNACTKLGPNCSLDSGSTSASLPGTYNSATQQVTTCMVTAGWLKANNLWIGPVLAGTSYDVGFTLPSGWPPALTYNGSC